MPAAALLQVPSLGAGSPDPLAPPHYLDLLRLSLQLLFQLGDELLLLQDNSCAMWDGCTGTHGPEGPGPRSSCRARAVKTPSSEDEPPLQPTCSSSSFLADALSPCVCWDSCGKGEDERPSGHQRSHRAPSDGSSVPPSPPASSIGTTGAHRAAAADPHGGTSPTPRPTATLLCLHTHTGPVPLHLLTFISDFLATALWFSTTRS